MPHPAFSDPLRVVSIPDYGDVRIYLAPDGSEAISVSSVLSLCGFRPPSSIPQAVLDLAAERGTEFHHTSELDDRGTLDEATVDPAIMPLLENWRRAKEQLGLVCGPDEIERVIYGRNGSCGWCGVLDRMGEVGVNGDRHRAVLDLKSGKTQTKSALYQTALYALAVNCACGVVVYCGGKKPVPVPVDVTALAGRVLAFVETAWARVEDAQ